MLAKDYGERAGFHSGTGGREHAELHSQGNRDWRYWSDLGLLKRERSASAGTPGPAAQLAGLW